VGTRVAARWALHFVASDVVAVLAPEDEHASLRPEIASVGVEWARRAVPMLDPRWGLERMIAELARVRALLGPGRCSRSPSHAVGAARGRFGPIR
jgi:hypothetical protein